MMRKRIDLNQPAKMIVSPDLIAQQDWRMSWKHRISSIGTVFAKVNLTTNAEASSAVESVAENAAHEVWRLGAKRPKRSPRRMSSDSRLPAFHRTGTLGRDVGTPHRLRRVLQFPGRI